MGDESDSKIAEAEPQKGETLLHRCILHSTLRHRWQCATQVVYSQSLPFIFNMQAALVLISMAGSQLNFEVQKLPRQRMERRKKKSAASAFS